MPEKTTGIPAFLLRQTPEPRFLVADDMSLTITTGEQTITLVKSDLARLRAFFNRFDTEADHAHA